MLPFPTLAWASTTPGRPFLAPTSNCVPLEDDSPICLGGIQNSIPDVPCVFGDVAFKSGLVVFDAGKSKLGWGAKRLRWGLSSFFLSLLHYDKKKRKKKNSCCTRSATTVGQRRQKPCPGCLVTRIQPKPARRAWCQSSSESRRSCPRHSTASATRTRCRIAGR